ncbi:MAG TPA: hypothetical protein VMA36_19055 [Candidatus Limnocylindria bacterium]|jgi:hypothetical protein|nr:hypothetical protein [Candidatus Limnocylindria bacterium]
MMRGGLPSGRAYAACALASLLILFAGEITGTHPVYPWHTRFSITPGPLVPASALHT